MKTLTKNSQESENLSKILSNEDLLYIRGGDGPTAQKDSDLDD